MRRRMQQIGLAGGLVIGTASARAEGFPGIPVTRCAADAVPAGTVCLDRYEASVWRVPNPTTTNATLVRRIQLGKATPADLAAGGGRPIMRCVVPERRRAWQRASKGCRVIRPFESSIRPPPLLIATTGLGQAEDRRRIAEAGFEHHLIKPLDPTVLQLLLRTGRLS